MTATLAPPPLRWDGTRLHVLDQTLLPAREEVLVLAGAEDTARAIERLSVRGAPLIGVAAAFGLAMEVAREPSLGALERGAERLATCRPTARNLAWAVERVRTAALAAGPVRLAGAARAEAEEIQREDAAASAALAEHGAALLDSVLPRTAAEPAGAGDSAGGPSAAARSTATGSTTTGSSASDTSAAVAPVTILTHCNSGCLAASGRGTGLGVIAALADRRPVRVLACEARPLLQGARLTVWELGRLGIEHALVVDAAAAGLIRTGRIDAVVTGLDRVAANGDVANKVGTYGLALAADAAGIPFVAAGPSSSVDGSLPSGDAIEIEERGADEVRIAAGSLLTVPGTPVRNPAFDVTPAALVWALVTERGVAQPVDAGSVTAVA
jgi:methylthioribose-1-phosphate isomerase